MTARPTVNPAMLSLVVLTEHAVQIVVGRAQIWRSRWGWGVVVEPRAYVVRRRTVSGKMSWLVLRVVVTPSVLLREPITIGHLKWLQQEQKGLGLVEAVNGNGPRRLGRFRGMWRAEVFFVGT